MVSGPRTSLTSATSRAGWIGEDVEDERRRHGLPPLLEGLADILLALIGGGRRLEVVGPQCVDERAQPRLRVGGDANGGAVVAADLLLVDVEMDDRRVATGDGPTVGGHLVGARPDEQDHVGVVYDFLRDRRAAKRPGHAGEAARGPCAQRVTLGKRSLPGDGVGDGNLAQLRQLA